MSKPLPSRFNPDLMARDGTRYEAVVPLAQFKRLVPMVASPEGELHALAVFSRRKDHVVVSGRLIAGLVLQCQRCLENYTLSVDAPYELVFVESEGAARDLPDALEPVILDDMGYIDLTNLFEDELIFQVPLAPLHGDNGDCVAAPRSFGDIAPEAAEPAEDNRQRPFDVLKDFNLH